MNISSADKVAILGLGKSAEASARFLLRQGCGVFLSELKEDPANLVKAEELREAGAQVETGSHSIDLIEKCDWVLISPGIPPSSPVYQSLSQKNVPMISEIELASRYSRARKVIAVTGTSGKTTVSTLFYRILNAAGKKTGLCGNIGNPWVGELGNEPEFMVLEVSSFQLKHCPTFRPDVAVILNISPNHLDWHTDMADYAGSKFQMIRNQIAGDVAIVRRCDYEQYFSENRIASNLIFYDEAHQGVSDNQNLAALNVMARQLDLQPEQVANCWTSFEGLAHRLEKAGSIHGVEFVNDSKCTTVSSLAWALKNSEGPVLLIAGGRAKSKNFEELRPLLKEKVRRAFLIGESAAQIEAAWAGAVPTTRSLDLEKAVSDALQTAKRGDRILLSPACASFDMFRGYEERGNVFKSVVEALAIKSNAVRSGAV